MRFDGRVAIVTGAGAGLGSVIARGLAREGAGVVVADLDERSARAVADEIVSGGGRTLAAGVDVGVASDVSAMVSAAREELGAVDLLVNNAARAVDDGPLEISEQDWDRDVAILLKGAFLCARAVLPGMVERGRGAIVSIGSVNARSYFGNEPYSAAKAGVESLTRSLAVRYGPDGVRANVVAPGTLRTAAWQARAERDPSVLERMAKWYPLGRVGEPEDVVGAVLFLLSDEAAWITGAVLPVDGGIGAGNPLMAREIVDPDNS